MNATAFIARDTNLTGSELQVSASHSPFDGPRGAVNVFAFRDGTEGVQARYSVEQSEFIARHMRRDMPRSAMKWTGMLDVEIRIENANDMTRVTLESPYDGESIAFEFEVEQASEIADAIDAAAREYSESHML